MELFRVVVVEAQAVADLVRQGHHIADGVLARELQPGRKNTGPCFPKQGMLMWASSGPEFLHFAQQSYNLC